MDTGFSDLGSSFNPFLLMIDADKVLAAVQRSDRLDALDRKVVRLLDGPGFDDGESQVQDRDD